MSDKAFPSQYTETVEVEDDHPLMSGFVNSLRIHPGLTKRELFAAMAMQAYLSNPHLDQGWTYTAEVSCKAADALISMLEKK